MSAASIRERSAIVFAAAEGNETRYFRVVPQRIEDVARRVANITRQRYPDLDVPCHSRWRHFSAGGIDRSTLVAPAAGIEATTRARIDLAVISVLLDAGAGPDWRYQETETGQTFGRSEGLAVASLRAMQAGLFSSDHRDPWRADAATLMNITTAQLAAALQHGPGNELVGIERRVLLLRRTGRICASNPSLFDGARPGGLYDHWRQRADVLHAAELLRSLLLALGPIWPSGARLGGIPLGDCARHSAVPDDGFVPFHKLSQWLAYSLIEPLRAGGIEVAELDGLTGLAEYRNGGLFVDCGVIEARDRQLLRRPLAADSEPVVEWRALTVTLLDRLAEHVRRLLGKSRPAFPLAKVLEGGSWAAGREVARERRSGGTPPLAIVGDGTLF